MIRTPEGRIAATLVMAAKKSGVFIRKLRWEGRLGAPDYIAIHEGKVFFIETKAPGELPRRSQVAEFSRLARAGVPVEVIDSATDAVVIIERIRTWKDNEAQDM